MKKKFTIITVVYNNYYNIEKTIVSVIQQTIYDQIEYIIIDGGSNDGTLDIIKKYESKISNIFSEKDDGIYDAMNKGIQKSSGDWINFMNSGDSFFNNSVLENISNYNLDNSQIIYGTTNCFNKKKNYLIPPKALENFNNNLPFCHQSSFVRRDIFMSQKFDIKYKIAADYNLFYSLYKNKCNFLNIDICISNYNIDEGISATKFYQLEKEIMIINGKWNYRYNRYLLFLKNIKFLISNVFKKILNVD